MVEQFDRNISAILKGGVIEGREIIASDNKAILDAVEELDKNHSDFQKAAHALMASHRATVEQAEKAEASMSKLDAFGEEAALMLDKVEQLAGEEMKVAKDEGAVAKETAMTVLIGVHCAPLLSGSFLG